MAIAGAGVVGSTTAYYLSQRGLRVAVIERRAAAAGATGCAHGGISLQGKPRTVVDWAAEGLRLRGTGRVTWLRCRV
ncbi:MAG: FAD-dependent oxidoreductase [Bacillota bacterium]